MWPGDEASPDVDLEGRDEMREITDSLEQRNFSGQGGGGEIGGIGLRVGVSEFQSWDRGWGFMYVGTSQRTRILKNQIKIKNQKVNNVMSKMEFHNSDK